MLSSLSQILSVAYSDLIVSHCSGLFSNESIEIFGCPSDENVDFVMNFVKPIRAYGLREHVAAGAVYVLLLICCAAVIFEWNDSDKEDLRNAMCHMRFPPSILGRSSSLPASWASTARATH